MKLLPCPFCGKEPKFDCCYNYWTITCEDSECFGYRYTDGEFGGTEPSSPIKDEVIKAWNTRIALNKDTEVNEAMMERDISVTGQYIEKDGKRIDPKDFYKDTEVLESIDGITLANFIHKVELLDHSRSQNNPRKWNLTSKQALMMAKAICKRYGRRKDVDVEEIKHLINKKDAESDFVIGNNVKFVDFLGKSIADYVNNL